MSKTTTAAPALRVCGLALLVVLPTAAQEAPHELARISGVVKIDGVPDEAAWREVPPLPLTVYSPVFGAEPSSAPRSAWPTTTRTSTPPAGSTTPTPSGIRVNSLYRDRLERRRRVRHLPRRLQRQPELEVVRHHAGGHPRSTSSCPTTARPKTTTGTPSGRWRRRSPPKAGSRRCGSRSPASASTPTPTGRVVDGADRDPTHLAQPGARDVSGDRPQVRVPPRRRWPAR